MRKLSRVESRRVHAHKELSVGVNVKVIIYCRKNAHNVRKHGVKGEIRKVKG